MSSILRVWTNGIEYDAVVSGSLGGRRIGSGFAFGDCARDMDFEYASNEERDVAYEKAIAMNGIVQKVERR